MILNFGFNLLQLFGGIVLSYGYVLQIRQIIKTKSVRDINLKTFCLFFLGVLSMEIYATNLFVHGSGGMFLTTNSMSLILCGTIVRLIIKYKK
jgi:MtN3 and saliva related transmembrane protein